MTRIVHIDDLPSSGPRSRVFEGSPFGAHVSFFLVDLDPDDGPPLHSHPYEELFVVQEGVATFTVGRDTIEARAGQIVIAPPDRPHRFVNSGNSPLRTVNIHPVPVMHTDWLESHD